MAETIGDSVVASVQGLFYVFLSIVSLGLFKSAYRVFSDGVKQGLKTANVPVPLATVGTNLLRLIEETLGSPSKFQANFTHVLLFAIVIVLIIKSSRH